MVIPYSPEGRTTMMPAPVRRHFGPLSGLDWPGPGRPLVVLHGVFDSAECWTGVVQQLAHQEPRCRVIGFDLDAHGQTPLPEGDFTVHAMVEHVIGALEAAGTEPVSLAGHSLGGLVAHEVALTRPDLVAALWLEDPAWAAAIEPLGRDSPLRPRTRTPVGVVDCGSDPGARPRRSPPMGRRRVRSLAAGQAGRRPRVPDAATGLGGPRIARHLRRAAHGHLVADGRAKPRSRGGRGPPRRKR
jgi:pimeloyl-ACP methyl ester carboxylesterase